MPATVLPRARLRAAVLCGLLASAAFAACVDPLHLDPAGAGAGATSASTGSAAKGCRSSAECAFPDAVCDTVDGKCVGCLTVSDCAYEPGTVCSKGACTCPSTTAAPLTYCGGVSPGCVDVETSAENCGGCGKVCDAGECMHGKCGGGGTGGGGTGGSIAGTGGGAGDAGCPTCDDALTKKGVKLCTASAEATEYDALKNCAGCSPAVGGCSSVCQADLCAGDPPSMACESCLMVDCMALYTTCMTM